MCSRPIAELAARNVGLEPKFEIRCLSQGGVEQRSGTISERIRLVSGADGGTIAMRFEYLTTIAIAALAAGLAVHSVSSLPLEKQSIPAAAQLASRLAGAVDPLLLGPDG